MQTFCVELTGHDLVQPKQRITAHRGQRRVGVLAFLRWAHWQGALSWELRFTTSLARLLRDQGGSRTRLRSSSRYTPRFTEGFDTVKRIFSTRSMARGQREYILRSTLFDPHSSSAIGCPTLLPGVMGILCYGRKRKGRNRRVSPVAVRPGECPLTAPIAAAQPRPQERVLMPEAV